MTDTPRQTKNQRREEAREAARQNRAKAEKRKSLLKWLVPTIASVAILAIVGGVVWAVFALQPAPKAEAGPANMISDGIVFEGVDGEVVPVSTPALKKGEEPTRTEPREGVLNIVELVDFSCPACADFESAYAPTIESLVAQGVATLEVRPVAILDYRGYTTDYSTRSNNVAACVANYEPENFLAAMSAMYAGQPPEGGPGLNNRGILKLVEGAGIDNPEIADCILNTTFTPWVTSATARSEVRSTPTIIINGTEWDRSVEFPDFITAELAKVNG